MISRACGNPAERPQTTKKNAGNFGKACTCTIRIHKKNLTKWGHGGGGINSMFPGVWDQ